MAQEDPASRISILTVLTEGRYTNWPVRRMIIYSVACLIAIAGSALAYLRKHDIPNWEGAVWFGLGIGAVAALAAYRDFRAARWRHYVQSTLDPANKGGL